MSGGGYKRVISHFPNKAKTKCYKVVIQRKFIYSLWRAKIIRFEKQTSLMLGKDGGSHVQRGIDMANSVWKTVEYAILVDLFDNGIVTDITTIIIEE